MGPYVGVLSAIYFGGRAVSQFFWGWVADRFGRKPVLYVSVLSSSLTLLMVAYLWIDRGQRDFRPSVASPARACAFR